MTRELRCPLCPVLQWLQGDTDQLHEVGVGDLVAVAGGVVWALCPKAVWTGAGLSFRGVQEPMPGEEHFQPMRPSQPLGCGVLSSAVWWGLAEACRKPPPGAGGR